MEIDIQDVKEYCFCPMYYKYKKENKKTKYINIVESYDFVIRQSIFSFFALISEGQGPSMYILKRTFGAKWIGRKTKEDVMYLKPGDWRDSHNERRKKGIKALVKFYDLFKERHGFPIALNKTYSVPISKNLNLTGSFEIIRELKDKNNVSSIDILHFRNDDVYKIDMAIDKDIEISALSFAFRSVFKVKEDQITIYSLHRGKSNITYRTKEDYRVMIRTIKNVAYLIKNKIFYAFPDNKCYSCIYKDVCYVELSEENMK